MANHGTEWLRSQGGTVNVTEAASFLGVGQTTLNRKIRECDGEIPVDVRHLEVKVGREIVNLVAIRLLPKGTWRISTASLERIVGLR